MWPIKRRKRRAPTAVLIADSALFTSCEPNQTKELLQPSQALGAVLAEQTAHAAGAKKQVAIIEPDANWGPVSAAEAAFKAAVSKQGFSIVIAKAADLGDPMRRGPVGLKAGEFFEAVEKGADAGAIISFAGAPLLKPSDPARLSRGHPSILVVATATLGNVQGVPGDRANLASLLDARIIYLAIVDAGPEPGAQGSGRTDAMHQLFSQHYGILRGSD